ncbi:MAG TPA: ABC transporter permease [Candidatus Limnocylindrales bacterium]|nr:ABC transporter permease [Candidatus Limnocylindrales bacterium]
MPLHLYIFRRFIFVIPVLLGITLMAFLIANAVPADPINANLSQRAISDPEVVAAFRAEWGLDKSLPEQYFTYVGNLLQGNLGRSIKSRQPVADDIARYMPATIELATYGAIIGITLGIGTGLVSAIWRNTWIDAAARTLSLIGISVPVFVLALLGLYVLHVSLGLTAGPGRLDFTMQPPPTVTGLYTVDALLAGQWDVWLNALSHLVLPSLVLGLFVAGIISRVTRSSMLEVLSMDYLRTARAKGLHERTVIIRHAFRNATIPIVTVIGLSYGSLLSGAVLTESIFAWPGIGRYMYRASTSQDFPAIMGVSLLFAFIFVMVNLVVDILYYFLDPRIRQS